MSAYVYLAERGGLYKIGASGRPPDRASALGARLLLTECIPDEGQAGIIAQRHYKAEQAVHRALESHRAVESARAAGLPFVTEWFRFESDAAAHMAFRAAVREYRSHVANEAALQEIGR